MFFFLRLFCLGAGEVFPNTCVQQWFNRKRGRAIGLVYTFQWLGGALFGTVVAAIVAQSSWQRAAIMGAVVNLILAPVSFLLIRRSPEACHLEPDGAPEATADVEGLPRSTIRSPRNAQVSPRSPRTLRTIDPAQFWVHFTFTFFYSMMFGGSDFYMVEMINETASPGQVSVAWHIFTPMAVASSISLPAVGELMDAYGHKKWLPPALLALAGFLAGIVTLLLSAVAGWFSAVTYGVLRGISAGIFQSLLSAGLCYSAQGVSRSEIGRILGYNQLSNLVGTGSANFWYGTGRDVSGSFALTLYASSIPILLLGAFFAQEAVRIKCHGD